MKPIEFEGQTHVLGKGQPEYQPLPAAIEGNCVTTCWEISEEELATMIKTKRLWLHQLTFGQPLQPRHQRASKGVQGEILIMIKRDKKKKGCSGKVKYKSEAEAGEVIRLRKELIDVDLRAYPCRHCRCWHLTSKQDNIKGVLK